MGVCFDEPAGLTDGSVKGVRYFECPGENYGSFVRGKNLSVGDFPERDLLDDESEDEEESGETAEATAAGDNDDDEM